MNANERDAVRRVRAGEREAFGFLVRSYQAPVFALVLMVVRNRTAAEDVTQDAFVRAFVSLHAYDETRPFYPWVATIAVRLAQNWLRQRGRSITTGDVEFGNVPEPVAAGSALQSLVEEQQTNRLWHAVARLPSGQRTALYLHYRDGLSVRDVAVAMGVAAGTVKTLLFRGRRHLRLALTGIGTGKAEWL